MKGELSTLGLGLILVPLLAGCTLFSEQASITGPGNIVTQEETFTGFDKVDVSPAFKDDIRQGDTFAGPLRQSKTVDLLVSNMVAVGEETGDLDKMLLKIADNYDEQVDVLVASLMSMLEPIMIVVLGAVVMTIVLAIFLPMIGIITSLSSSS